MLPHDLLRVAPGGLHAPGGAGLPSSARAAALTADGSAWVVVRRGRAPEGRVAVGIRGADRAARWAAEAERAAVQEAVRPWQVPLPRTDARADLPALRTLRAVRDRVDGPRAGLHWGPAGSVAFELTTGRPVVTAASDLDLVVDAPVRWTRDRARELVALLAGLEARCDVQLLTPLGGVALAEWAATGGDEPVAVRTPDGPRLVLDPWAAP